MDKNDLKKYDDMPAEMIKLAHTAWEHLMLEKMKKAYDALPGNKMGNSAKLIVNHVMEYWDKKMKGGNLDDKAIEDFQKKLMELMS